MDSELKEILIWLDKISVRFRPKSIGVYDRVLSLSKIFESLSADQRGELVLEVTDNLSKKLLAFSGFFAESALTTGDSRWIRGAIVLHFIENVRQDYRESIRYLALIDYACLKIGIKFEEVFSSVSALALPPAKKCIDNYISLSRDPADIECFGMKVAPIDGHLRFVPI